MARFRKRKKNSQREEAEEREECQEEIWCSWHRWALRIGWQVWWSHGSPSRTRSDPSFHHGNERTEVECLVQERGQPEQGPTTQGNPEEEEGAVLLVMGWPCCHSGSCAGCPPRGAGILPVLPPSECQQLSGWGPCTRRQAIDDVETNFAGEKKEWSAFETWRTGGKSRSLSMLVYIYLLWSRNCPLSILPCSWLQQQTVREKKCVILGRKII